MFIYVYKHSQLFIGCFFYQKRLWYFFLFKAYQYNHFQFFRFQIFFLGSFPHNIYISYCLQNLYYSIYNRNIYFRYFGVMDKN